MERNAQQIEVLAQLLGLEDAKRVVALVTLAEAVVGLDARVRQLEQAQQQTPPPTPAAAAPAVYAVEEEDAA